MSRSNRASPSFDPPAHTSTLTDYDRPRYTQMRPARDSVYADPMAANSMSNPNDLGAKFRPTGSDMRSSPTQLDRNYDDSTLASSAASSHDSSRFNSPSPRAPALASPVSSYSDRRSSTLPLGGPGTGGGGGVSNTNGAMMPSRSFSGLVRPGGPPSMASSRDSYQAQAEDSSLRQFGSGAGPSVGQSQSGVSVPVERRSTAPLPAQGEQQIHFIPHDLDQVVELFDCGSKKFYKQGTLDVMTDDNAGFENNFVRLSGVVISQWSTEALQEAQRRGGKVDPKYHNITDASVAIPPPSRDLPPYCFVLSTGGRKRITFSATSEKDRDTWVHAINLAIWERERLCEIFTGTLIGIGATQGNDITKDSFLRGKTEGYLMCRVDGKYSEPYWCVLNDGFSEKKRRTSILGLPRMRSNSSTQREGPTASFYRSKKDKKPEFVLQDLFLCAAEYPERTALIVATDIFKVQGTRVGSGGPFEISRDGTNRSTSPTSDEFDTVEGLYLIPEGRGQGEMLKWIVSFINTFKLYEWTERTPALLSSGKGCPAFDPLRPESFYFVYPKGPVRPALFLHPDLVDVLNPHEERPRMIRQGFRNILLRRIRGIPPPPPPPTHNGNGAGPISMVTSADQRSLSSTSTRPPTLPAIGEAAPLTGLEKRSDSPDATDAERDPQPEVDTPRPVVPATLRPESGPRSNFVAVETTRAQSPERPSENSLPQSPTSPEKPAMAVFPGGLVGSEDASRQAARQAAERALSSRPSQSTPSPTKRPLPTLPSQAQQTQEPTQLPATQPSQDTEYNFNPDNPDVLAALNFIEANGSTAPEQFTQRSRPAVATTSAARANDTIADDEVYSQQPSSGARYGAFGPASPSSDRDEGAQSGSLPLAPPANSDPSSFPSSFAKSKRVAERAAAAQASAAAQKAALAQPGRARARAPITRAQTWSSDEDDDEAEKDEDDDDEDDLYEAEPRRRTDTADRNLDEQQRSDSRLGPNPRPLPVPPSGDNFQRPVSNLYQAGGSMDMLAHQEQREFNNADEGYSRGQSFIPAFSPHGLLQSGLQDKHDKSAKNQEALARETGGPLINVPSKPPPPQTGLVGAIASHERERKRDGGMGATLTERERERKMAEARQRELDAMQRQQLAQGQMMGGSGGFGGYPYPVMPMMMPPSFGMMPGMAPGMSPGMSPGMAPGMNGQQMYEPMNPMFQHQAAAMMAAQQAYFQAMASFSQAGPSPMMGYPAMSPSFSMPPNPGFLGPTPTPMPNSRPLSSVGRVPSDIDLRGQDRRDSGPSTPRRMASED